MLFQRVKELEEENENLQEKIQALEASAVSDIKYILKLSHGILSNSGNIFIFYELLTSIWQSNSLAAPKQTES